ncbi:MAG: maleylpyruvate isomerase N-terminal domain-containing protein, partial [Pseudonocardia sp.]|nr:maleylpyruvate isomerase N-terminal domain-containing protein [Pseudonocardia sp.]
MSTTMEQYLQAWTRLARLADAVPEPAWDAPSPCADWTARQLAGHLVDGARQVQALLQRRPPLVPVTDPTALAGLAGDNPRAALRDAA